MKQINIKKVSTAVFVFLCVLAMSAGSASYGHISSHGKLIKEIKVSKEHTTLCKSHLQNVSYTQDYKMNAQSAADTNRGKSKALAVGILFGARYALGPVEGNGERTASAEVTKVQAIKDYRTCLKERALKS